MELKLDIKAHCIQTEAKRTYEQLMSRYFKQAGSDADLSALEEQIEALVYFLGHADFGYLRKTYPFLNGNQEGAAVVLNIPGDLEDMTLVFDKQVIDIVQ